MNIAHPIIGITWEIWARSKWKWLAALICLFLCRLMCDPSSALAPTLGFGITALSIFLVMSSYHFTEGDRKAGFGSFPKRFFTMPITTRQLVWTPMGLGTFSVICCYLIAVYFLLRPLGQNPAIGWPCLYLSCGMASFQAIIWAFPDRRYLKLFLLSIFATILALGWLFFLPHMLEGTLQQFGISSSPRRFQQGLMITLILWTVGAYLFAWLVVKAQRVGRERFWSGWQGFNQIIKARRVHRKKVFSNASSALFWMEWHQSGKVLPWAILILMLVTFIPTYLTSPHNESETMAATIWMLSTPLVLSLVIGLGASKPDFWKPELNFPLFQATKPIRAGDWVYAKLKVAFASVAVTWLIIFLSLVIWIGHMGDLNVFEPLWMFFKGYQRHTLNRALFIILGAGTLMLISLRLYLLSLPGGLSGSCMYYYAMNTCIVAALFCSIAFAIRQSQDDSSLLKLHQIWPAIMKLPWMIFGAVLIKCLGVARVWYTIQRDSIASNNSIWWIMVFWALSTLWLIAFVIVAIPPGVTWLYHLLLASTLLVCPLLSPGLAMLCYFRNRSR